MVKVAFYKGRDRIFNRLVSWWTRGPYSHCELVVDGKWYSSSFMDGGVRVKDVDPHPGKWDFIEIPEADEEYAVKWFQDNMGKGYDVLGLVGFIFRRVGDDQKRFFCSEAVSASLQFPEAWRLDPNTFASVARRFAAVA